MRIILLCFLCAALELLQAIFYHNAFEWHDLAVDYLAIALSPCLLYAGKSLIRIIRDRLRSTADQPDPTPPAVTIP
jgi:hypothetical protein